MTRRFKLVVYVPKTHAALVREAIGNAGGGTIGEKYSFCSFSTGGTGRFKPEEGAHPYRGAVGTHEEVEEERIEVTCDGHVLDAVISAMKKVHPYEEMAYDVYPLEDR